MSNNISEWEELVAKIREWDRREHNWAVTIGVVDPRPGTAKEIFIKTLMREYDLKKK
jgi:hypothetical protein